MVMVMYTFAKKVGRLSPPPLQFRRLWKLTNNDNQYVLWRFDLYTILFTSMNGLSMCDDLTVPFRNVLQWLRNFEICVPKFDSDLLRFWLDNPFKCTCYIFVKIVNTNLCDKCNVFVWMKYSNAVKPA